MSPPSNQINEASQNNSHKKELQKGCEVFEAIKTIGKMIVLYYSTKKE